MRRVFSHLALCAVALAGSPPLNPGGITVNHSQVAFFLLSTTSKGSFYHDNTRAIPAMQSWARHFPHVWFVFPDNAVSQRFVSGCAQTTRTPVAESERVVVVGNTTKEVRIVEADCGDGRPLLLTSHPRFNCSDHHWGQGPCCKANFV